jgi:hypothetical protein
MASDVPFVMETPNSKLEVTSSVSSMNSHQTSLLYRKEYRRTDCATIINQDRYSRALLQPASAVLASPSDARIMVMYEIKECTTPIGSRMPVFRIEVPI